MRRLAALLTTLILAACGTAAPVATTTTEPLTLPPVGSTTTTTFAQDYVIQDCASPPVTFSSLCEVYELVQAWHVDRPVDPGHLAEIATTALGEYAGEETEPPPRTLFCAIPDPAFTTFCENLAELVGVEQIAAGPLVDSAVVAMTDVGLDPFTYYLPPEQAAAFRSNGVVGGVGVFLDATDAAGSRCARITPQCPLEVVFVLEENPGAAAGLMAGDLITAVNGVPVDGQGFTVTAGEIAGDETGLVELTVSRDGETITYDIERAELVVPTVDVDVFPPDVDYPHSRFRGRHPDIGA